MSDYAAFLDRKIHHGRYGGFTPVYDPDFLFDFIKAAIHADDDDAARHEAMQLAAVAYRFYRDGWER